MQKMFLDIETLPADESLTADLLDIYNRKVDKASRKPERPKKDVGTFDEFM